MTFYIEQNETETIIPVHRIKYPNLNTTPNLRDPNMRIGIGINTDGTTTNTNPAVIETISCATFLQGDFKSPSIYRSYGYIITGNDKAIASNTSRSSPAVLFGLNGINNFQTTNSNGSSVYAVNNTNIFFSTISLSINATTATASKVNLIFMIVRNPTSVLVKTSSTVYATANVPKQKYNNNLISVTNGVVVNVTGTTGYFLSGGEIVLEYSLTENTNLVLNISDLNILMGPTESYYLCFYGNATIDFDISGSLSYNINM